MNQRVTIFDDMNPTDDIAKKASEGVHVACEEQLTWLDEAALSHEDTDDHLGDDIVPERLR